MKIEELIAGVQKKLRVQVDGRAGPETWGAIYADIVKPKIAGVAPWRAIEPVDSRSEKNIATLLAPVRPIARSLVQKRRKTASTSKSSAGSEPMPSKTRSMPKAAPNPAR